MRRVLVNVSRAFGISMERLLAKTSGWSDLEAAHARMAAYSIAKDKLGLGHFKIGSLIGDRHHTSVLHGVRRCAELIANDPDFAAAYERARG